ncbi:MAG TPA: MarR family transcriptional regulator [Microbacteriaceae bacterium]
MIQQTERAEPPSTAVAAELRIVLGRLSRRMREQGSIGDLTESQKSALGRLERDGAATKSSLARAEGVTPQSMGVIIAGLEAAGLVSGTPDPNDGRKTLLSLTDAARERFATGRLAREGWLHRAIQAELDASEQEQLGSCIELLKRLTQSP